MKKKKKPVFLIFYLFFLLANIALWVWVVCYVHNCLLRYEAAQPERVVEELTERMAREGASSVFTVNGLSSPYEPAELAAECYDESVRGKTITWQQDKTRYDISAPAYQIYADGEEIGRITLRELSSEQLMFILSLSKWELASAEPVLEEGQESVTVVVPEGYGVLVNEQSLTETELTGDSFIPEQFQYAKEYVDVPRVVEYQVEGLLKKPVVGIVDQNGDSVAYEEDYEEGHTQIVVDTFPVEEMDPGLAAQVLENAKRYSNFFSRDLAGCQASIKPIADMFPKDSYYLTLADTYRREDMWMYSAHATPSFENEEVSNYIPYSDELFSCEVYFDKHIQLTKVAEKRVDVTHERFFYGLLDGEWKILDIQTLLD